MAFTPKVELLVGDHWRDITARVRRIRVTATHDGATHLLYEGPVVDFDTAVWESQREPEGPRDDRQPGS